MTQMEDMYFRVLLHWWKHRDYGPTLRQLGNLCRPRKSPTAVRVCLLKLETKGYTTRDRSGHFLVVQ